MPRQENQSANSSFNMTIDSNVQFPCNYAEEQNQRQTGQKIRQPLSSSKNNGKGNFVEEMRKRLNQYNLEKIKMLQVKRQKQEWYQQQIRAKNSLMEIDQSSLIQIHPSCTLEVTGRGKNEEITGWNYQNQKQLKNCKDRRVVSQGRDKERENLMHQNMYGENTLEQSLKLVSARIMDQKPTFMQNTHKFNFNSQVNRLLEQGILEERSNKGPNMIIHLKSLLNRLQSPKPKRQLQTHNRQRILSESKDKNPKLKTQQTVAKIRKSKLSLNRINNYEGELAKQKIVAQGADFSKAKNKEPEQLKTNRKHVQRAKFQLPMSSESENRPFTIQQSKQPINKDYQKIKRQSVNQYDIDISHQKDILQQLIRGSSSGNRAQSTSYYSQRSNGFKGSEKFTLKNLLC